MKETKILSAIVLVTMLLGITALFKEQFAEGELYDAERVGFAAGAEDLAEEHKCTWQFKTNLLQPQEANLKADELKQAIPESQVDLTTSETAAVFAVTLAITEKTQDEAKKRCEEHTKNGLAALGYNSELVSLEIT